MKKVSKTTINYAAKQAYQLFLMRGINRGKFRTVNGVELRLSVFPALGIVTVYIDGQPRTDVPIRKAWRSFL